MSRGIVCFSRARVRVCAANSGRCSQLMNLEFQSVIYAPELGFLVRDRCALFYFLDRPTIVTEHSFPTQYNKNRYYFADTLCCIISKLMAVIALLLIKSINIITVVIIFNIARCK